MLERIKQEKMNEAADECWGEIDFPRPQLFPDKEIKFFAEYFDGFQAPFVVCRWKDSFGELERLLKSVSEELYKAYRGRKRYCESLANTPHADTSQFSDIKPDIRGMLQYCRRTGKSLSELTPEEKERFCREEE